MRIARFYSVYKGMPIRCRSRNRHLFLTDSPPRMEGCELDMMRRILNKLGILLLVVSRTVYCWAFLIISIVEIHTLYTNFRKWHILTNLILIIYCLVLGVAWWMIFRGKPTQKRWAIAANIIVMFPFFPAMAFGDWRDILKGELNWWPFILIGIIGIIIFSIPFQGWRHRSTSTGAAATN